jgi:hypothetical protein
MAPIITALLGNGLSLIANAVLAKGTAYVKEKTGIDLSEAKTVTSEQMVALKQYEMEHEEELLKLRIEENKLDLELQKKLLEDLDSARRRELGIAQSEHASWLQRNATPLFGLIGLAVAFLLFFVMLNGNAEWGKNNKDILVYVLGVLSAVVTQIFNYYFGSSSGSRAKSDQLEKIIVQGGKS